MDTNRKLITGWQKCNLDSAPYLFPSDESQITNSIERVYRSFDEYVVSSDFGDSSDTHLHTGLLPIPYVGNLSNATIYVLMLNPGLSPGDYFAEQHRPDFREELVRNLRQENADDSYPFFFLNPHFAWHPGFGYWHKKFHKIIKALSEQLEIPYQRALSEFARSVACLELFPHHSKNFGVGNLLKTLPSVQAMLDFADKILLPKARNDTATIVVTRSAKHWQLPKHKNIVVYEGGETRSAHLTLSSKGGKAIAKRLGLKVKSAKKRKRSS